MKARTMNRTIEIPDERLERGGVERHADESSRKGKSPGNTGTNPQGYRLSGLDSSGNTRTKVENPSLSPLSFTLLGQIPSGKNAVMITRTGRRYPSKRFKAWRDEAITQLTSCDTYMMTNDVQLIVDYVPGNKIRRDVPGMLDAICHLLEYTGILQDDAQVKNVQWHQWPLDRKYPKCRVTISRLGA